MKRPLFIAAALVLSGMVCGIKESGLTSKAAAIILTAVLIVFIMSGYFEEDNPLIFVRRNRYKFYLVTAALTVFLLGFIRGAVQSHIYNTPECVEFYDYYRPTNPGLFDYSLYLKSLGISSREEYEAYKNASSDLTDTPPVMCMLNTVKEHCIAIFDTTLSEHDAGIYKAVILGDKSDMDSEIRNLYQDAGIAHLLAVSGLHVSMIGASLYNILRRKLNARKSAIAASTVLFMYMLMTGASGSVIRAVIMLILNIAAAVIGRNYCMTTAISISAIVVMLYRPYMIFTSGFQLSFGAVASISLISQNVIKRIELLLENSEQNRIYTRYSIRRIGLNVESNILSFIRSIRHNANQYESICERINRKEDLHNNDSELSKYIRHCNRLKAPVKAFIVSASIQLGTLPIIAYHFYKIPVYGILLNFIVIPLMAAVIASGMSLIGIWTAAGAFTGIANITKRLISDVGLTTLGDMADSPNSMRMLLVPIKLLTAVAAAPGHYVLLFYEKLSSWSLKLPYATVCIGRPSMLQIIVYYLILTAAILWILKPRRIPRRRIAMASIVFLIALVLNTNILRYRDTSELYVTAIDVGQGDSFLIKKGKHAILIDGGSSSRSNIGKNVIESFLMAKGISKLSCIAVSHADSDHINGIEYLLSDESDISTEVLVLPQAAENDADYDELKTLFLYGETDITVNAAKHRILYPQSGSVVCEAKDFSITCLYPGAAGDDKNRQSLVLLLKSGDFTMLFTGDTEDKDEQIFTDEQYLESIGLADIFSARQLTVLKAAHHGSHSANTEAIFDAFKPQAILVSCGKNNRYGHPHEDVLERAEACGSRILRTDESGAVSIYVEGGSIRVVKYKCNKERT